ncbi:MAG: 5'-3' exonuclease H3TH domain-containing protein, partial [Bosea sp. (in: a-proteobacteria)]
MSASDSDSQKPTPHPVGEAHPRPLKAGDHVFLVDGSNFIFRAYFQSMNQDRKYNYRSDGLPSGAVRLFATKLFQFVREGVMGVKPTHLAIIFDKSENSFRKALYPAYKANRSAPPPDLIPQFPLMRAAVSAFGLVPVEQDTYEADDLIATYARQAREAGADVTIISADKDLMQLIRPGVTMYDPASGDQKKGTGRAERIISEPEVVEYFGVTPDKVVDVQALAGDATDNVPGAPGIGIKTAAQLIGEYGDLDTLLARASEIKQPKRRETLTNPDIIAQVRISKQLVQLVDDAPMRTPLTDLGCADPEPAVLVAFLKAMEFTTITKRVAEAWEAEVSAIEPEPALAPGGSRAAELLAVFKAASGTEDGASSSSLLPSREKVAASGQVYAVRVNLTAQTDEGGGTSPSPGPSGRPLPQGERESGLAATRLAELRRILVDHARYEMITEPKRLKEWITMAREAGVVAVDTETSALDAMAADLVGISLSVAPGMACYIPLAHRGGSDLFGSGLVEGQMKTAEAIALLKPLLEDAGVLKVGQNLKYDWLVFARHGIEIT